MLLNLTSFLYKNIAKPIFFLFDPKKVHDFTTSFGELLGKNKLPNKILYHYFGHKSPVIKQKIAGIDFKSPIGLAAGWDYEAKAVNILPSFGFGFNTVGTITNYPYGGNPSPMLGRLPKSKSLMVNKGFKNQGALEIVKKISEQTFKIPLGISIGKSNIPQINTQADAITDIISAFKIFENSKVENSYYELNISCPNLYGNVTFYKPDYLNDLLVEVDKLKLKKPIFIKMPITLSNRQTLNLLDVIVRHKIAGVIIGNLQNRKSENIEKSELKNWKVGNFSGKSTWKRSNQLIKLTYSHIGHKLIIIGCGGIFSAEDAYIKVKLGASLVQLITGLIYEGPALVAKINRDLPELLERDGYKNISEAIGVNS